VTVVLRVVNSEGARRCDARCHTSRAPRCRCICAGRYHGCGDSTTAEGMVTSDLLEGRMGEETRHMAEEALGLTLQPTLRPTEVMW
jgi:hypothetical protein